MTFSKNQKRITGVFSIIILGVFIFIHHINNDKVSYQDNNFVVFEKQKNYFKDLTLEAKSVFVWDIKNQEILYSLNEEAQLPLASVTKLMTALVSSEILPKETIITIDNEDIRVEGDSGLIDGEKWKFNDILDFTLMTSSNDGAHALASVVNINRDYRDNLFIEKMNKKARELNLKQTFFLNESGLDLNEFIGGAYGSAKDMTFLMEKIVLNRRDILKATKYSNLSINSKDFVHRVENTNKFAESIPGIIGSKTGFTDLAGGNLVISFDVGINHPIIVSVLGSTRDGRFEDVQKLVYASIEKIGDKN